MPAKSQWDFGELFPPEQISRKIFSVAELTGQIRRLLEQHIGRLWITGEITNLRLQSSGHIYFTLKDNSAQIQCVLFRGEFQVDRTVLEDGRKVVLQGELTVYETRGQYQLRVTAAELQGMGALQAAFDKLKQKLSAEGLFAHETKQPLPRFPERIGVVTSPTGAAIRDVLHVVRRRNPSLQIILAPCRVQGEGAGAEIAAAIDLLNSSQARLRLDAILVTRGGGSLEDLWAFNEEIVARAIHRSALPVISGIGHEIDITISDFVADVRAATPSAAAEILTEGVFASCQFISDSRSRLQQLVAQQFSIKTASLNRTAQRLERVHPRRRFEGLVQRIDDLQNSLSRRVAQALRRYQVATRNLKDRLSRVRPGIVLKHRKTVLHQTEQRLAEQARHRLRIWHNRTDNLQASLRLLGPEHVLARGYSITMDEQSGEILRNAGSVTVGQRLKTRLKAGEIRSTVTED